MDTASTSLKSQRRKEKYIKLKSLVFSKYGGKCVCCGESELIFLTIDHVVGNGNGNSHRRSLTGTTAGGEPTYQWIVKNNFPEGFQVMCHNCNHAKHVLGSCPHKWNAAMGGHVVEQLEFPSTTLHSHNAHSCTKTCAQEGECQEA